MFIGGLNRKHEDIFFKFILKKNANIFDFVRWFHWLRPYKFTDLSARYYLLLVNFEHLWRQSVFSGLDLFVALHHQNDIPKNMICYLAPPRQKFKIRSQIFFQNWINIIFRNQKLLLSESDYQTKANITFLHFFTTFAFF